MNQPNWPLSEDNRPSYSDDDVDFSQETHQRAQMQYSHLNAGILPLMETQQQDDEATIPLNALYFEQTALDVDDDDGSSMPAYIGSDIDDYDEGIAVYNAQMNNPELTFHVLDEDDDAPDAFNNESLEPAEYLSEIITDAEYADWIGIRWTGEFPFSENIDEDLRALVLGALMAKGENIDCGYEIEQFDALLQEVTGRRLDVVCDFISLSSLACFLSLSPEEEKKIKHAKINVLLHDTFKDFVQYNTADGNVKVKIPPILVDLYETLKKTESTRVKRKEQAEKAKNDVMNNPANRRRYMITNNLLVELIVMARNTNFETEISWNHIRDEYREMMETKNALYQRYCKLLNLEKVFEIGKYELNEASTRELFGRSSITKALSVPLFRKIRIGNDTKRNLVLSLTESDPKDCLYKQEEFAAIDAEIKKHEVVMRDQMKKKEEMVRSQHKEYKIAEARKKKEVNQARRARELEERKKDYIPVALDEVYVPGGDETSAAEDRRPVVSESNCGFQFQQPIVLEPRRPDAFQKSLIGGIRVSPDTTNESIVPSTDQIEELEYSGNIFGNVESNAINLSDVSSISDEVTQSAPDFTDEEGKEPVSRHLPDKKSRAEQRTSTPINNQWDAPKQPQPKECCPSQQSSEKQRAPRPSPLPQHPAKETRVDNHSQMSNRPRRQFPPMQSSRLDISNYSFTTAPREQSTLRMYSNSSLTAEQYNQPNLFRSPRYAPESNTTTLARDVLNVNEMQPQELFVQYLTLHVFVHRKITGAPQRFWSQIQRHLPLPLNRPEFIFGPNWITELSNISHGLEIIRLLFEWKDDHFNMSTNFSESSH